MRKRKEVRKGKGYEEDRGKEKGKGNEIERKNEEIEELERNRKTRSWNICARSRNRSAYRKEMKKEGKTGRINQKRRFLTLLPAAPWATLVPLMPIARPTSAAFRAGASFVPSPVTPTTWPPLRNIW